VSDERVYRLCSSCRKPIPYQTVYWACSVSTCNRKRTGLYFCSVACWDVHLPEARHREAWAEERRAPSREEAAREDAADEHAGAPPPRAPAPPPPRAPTPAPAPAPSPAPPAEAPARRVVVAPRPAPAPAPEVEAPREVLVVVSKLKSYVRAATGMNTSDGVIDVLSDHLRRLADAAARVAAGDGRKTIMDRDFRTVLSDWDD
jgi:hypothetical protein